MKALLIIVTIGLVTNCTSTKKETKTPANTATKQETNTKHKNVTNLPEATVIYDDIVYKTVSNTSLTLDLYVPNKTIKNAPLLIWTHGGAWMRGSKEAFVRKNNRLLNTLLNEGYAVASIGYRLSANAIFPAQIQDCNDAINFLWENSTTFNINKDKFATMGRSAGGHLAALVAMSNAHNIPEFFTTPKHPKFKIRALVDFFGPADLVAMRGKGHDEDDAPEAKFLGGSPLKLPEIAKKASPVTYVNSKTPPTILLHGISDKIVPSSQSELLKAALDTQSITNEIYLVDDARHGDPTFDSEKYVGIVLTFLKKHFPAK